MKTKTTRRALLMSALSILLCVSMLVGTTFAWFTDEVKSGRNQIVAGNLDVVLEYWNPTTKEYDEVTSAVKLFNDASLWEPGHTEVAYLKVTNAGTLALKYQMNVNVFGETTGLTEKGEVITLSEHLVFKVVESESDLAGTYDRETARDAAGTEKGLKTYSGDTKIMATKGETDYLALIIYMPESVGNEANYRGDAVPQIQMGVNLFATQYTYEKDSFDEKYDKDTAVFTVADANAMLAENKDVTLVNAIEPNETVKVPEGYTGTLTLYNVTIAGVQEVPAATTYALTRSAQPVNIVVEGTVVVKAVKDDTSAISAKALNITGNGNLTAVGKGKAAFGIGGMETQIITIKGITIDYVAGGYAYGVGTDTKYYKDAPEGGAAIGSGLNGAVITLEEVEITKAIGGSKAAGIGARYHVGVTVNITDSIIEYVEGGVSAAAIGGSRVSGDCTENGNVINITGSAINAVGGAYGAGIGSGYDTHCMNNGQADKQPMCEINIADSTITAKGGKYAAGVGTGYHNAALSGEIKNSTINAASGDKFYKDAYSVAMDIGFGVTDPAREGKQTQSYLTVNGQQVTLNDAPYYTVVADGLFKDAAGAYLVSNADGLATLNSMMADKTAGKNAVVNLLADIDFAGKVWTPVDSHADTAFSLAEINGNGYTIKNLTVNGQAMFKRFAGSGDVVIKDITFDNATVNSTSLNASILTAQSYQNVTLDNVDVKNSTISGSYKVAALIATVYNESDSTVTATLKNCDVYNTTVHSNLDFMVTGLVAFVYEDDNDRVVFENCTVTKVTLSTNSKGYNAVAAVYCNDGSAAGSFDEVTGVTVTDVTKK